MKKTRTQLLRERREIEMRIKVEKSQHGKGWLFKELNRIDGQLINKGGERV